MAASVSAVSPDCGMPITRVAGSKTGSRYRNSLATSICTGTRASCSIAYETIRPAWYEVPQATMNTRRLRRVFIVACRTSYHARLLLSYAIAQLARVPEQVEQLLLRDSAVTEIARRYHDERFFLYLGRGMGFAVCLEGALKLKEISYIPTEAYAAGEMKHGPIALLDKESPVVVVADDGPVFPKLVSNIEE